ncbi:MAG TPA: ATP-binding cassette domain-containing protein, partial [Puia sp.]|nr:ATP-binding cassette domain-containing protein [Puia sp.]
MSDSFLSLENLGVIISGQPVLQQINLTIHRDEQWAVTGPSGSGKTVLAHTLCGRHFFSGRIIASFGEPETFHSRVAVVDQQHRFRDLTNRSDFYYQQRYNSFDADQTVTVEEDLAVHISNEETAPGRWSLPDFLRLLRIEQLLQEPLIQLSNGENKRLQLLKALLQRKDFLILDQPFIGLDAEGRSTLEDVLKDLDAHGIRMLLITSPQRLPGYITHVAVLDKGNLRAAIPRAAFDPSFHFLTSLPVARPLPAPPSLREPTFEFAVKMKNVHIQYGGRTILQNLDWNVRRGERWSVSGRNGAGKSTLLSLVTGDHPQAYANEIYLFDRRRGTGESIWDIKRRIGYVSPELHLYFEASSTVFQAIASGLFDTIGLFRRLDTAQEATVCKWMAWLQLEVMQHKPLWQLSTGMQRLVLLARALVKSPP